MKLCDLKPNPSLRQYISRYWVWENEQDFPPILPGTGTELMFHYNDPFVAQNQNEKIFTAPSCHIISPRFDRYQLNAIRPSGFISVRFRAGAFRHFCGESTSDLIDSFIDINDLPKLQLQVEHFGQMAANSSSIKAVEKRIKKFFWSPIAEALARSAIQIICKPQYIFGSVSLNRNTLRDILT